MSHLVIQPIDVVYVPEIGDFSTTWHSLDTKRPGGIAHDGSNIQRVLRPVFQCGLKPDFNAPCCNFDSSAMADIVDPLKDYKLLMVDLRADGLDLIPLHVPKQGYKIHQNADIFQSAIDGLTAVMGNQFEIATVGTLGAYSQFFLSISLKGLDTDTVKPGDVHKSFLNFVSSHNSLTASARLMSIVRMVCMNTVQAALADADSTGFKSVVKHTENSGEHITAKAVEADIVRWTTTKAAHFAALRSMENTSMNVDQFRAFAAGVFTNEKSDNLSTHSYNRIEAMTPLFKSGKGNRGETLFDAFNAFTEFFTSGAGVGGKDVATNKRVASANLGRGNDWKLTALNIASDEQSLTAALKRGETLYTDKLVDMSTGGTN